MRLHKISADSIQIFPNGPTHCQSHQSIDQPSNPISIHWVIANPCPRLNWIDTDWPFIAEDNPVVERGTSLLQGPTVGFSGAWFRHYPIQLRRHSRCNHFANPPPICQSYANAHPIPANNPITERGTSLLLAPTTGLVGGQISLIQGTDTLLPIGHSSGDPMSIQCQSVADTEDNPVTERGTRLLWGPTEVSCRRAIQTTNYLSDANRSHTICQSQTNLTILKPIRQSTNGLTIQCQSQNNLTIQFHTVKFHPKQSTSNQSVASRAKCKQSPSGILPPMKYKIGTKKNLVISSLKETPSGVLLPIKYKRGEKKLSHMFTKNSTLAHLDSSPTLTPR